MVLILAKSNAVLINHVSFMGFTLSFLHINWKICFLRITVDMTYVILVISRKVHLE